MRLTFVAGLVLLGVCMSGCGTGTQPWASSAERDVHRRADNAGFAMAKAERGDTALEHARRVVGGEDGGVQIVVLEAEGTGMDGHVVLRIASVYDDDGPLDHDSSASACFRYSFGDRSGGTQPDEVSCPDRDPIPLPPPPFEPTLPANATFRLSELLRTPDWAARAATAFPERGLNVRTADKNGVIGIAVGAGPGQCLMGRRLTNGHVETWHLPRIMAMPGEIGCDPTAAATGIGQESPH